MKNEEFATALSAPGSTSSPPRGGVREGLEGGLFGLIGFPLGHSFSRGYFTEKFAREGIDAQYLNFEIPDASMLLDVIRDNPELRGLNVTLPHKQAVIPLLDELSDEAREIGAVNVIKIDPPQPSLKGRENGDVAGHRSLPLREGWGGSLKGFNSDIIGFMESIKPLLQPWHKKALVLGTGGASKAICVGLKRLGIEWRYVSRNGGQGARSKEQENTSCPNNPLAPCPLPLAPLNYSDLTPEVMAEYTVIVNCTPVGMFPKVDAAPAIPYELLTPRHLLFDCVYNPEDTLFLKRGREQGATGKNGLEMLHLQAEASWKFWNE
jgi:shikimate dehydrogenase